MSRNRNVKEKLSDGYNNYAESGLACNNVDFDLNKWNTASPVIKSSDGDVSVSSGKISSSSSLSWAEDYEQDGTTQVQIEFDRMQRVLQRTEAIPDHYDKDEYKLWIKTFPHLSLIERRSATSTRTLTRNDTADSPRVASTTSASVINDAFQFDAVQSARKRERSSCHRSSTLHGSHGNGQLNRTLNPMTLEDDRQLFSFLRISAATPTSAAASTRNRKPAPALAAGGSPKNKTSLHGDSDARGDRSVMRVKNNYYSSTFPPLLSKNSANSASGVSVAHNNYVNGNYHAPLTSKPSPLPALSGIGARRVAFEKNLVRSTSALPRQEQFRLPVAPIGFNGTNNNQPPRGNSVSRRHSNQLSQNMRQVGKYFDLNS